MKKPDYQAKRQANAARSAALKKKKISGILKSKGFQAKPSAKDMLKKKIAMKGKKKYKPRNLGNNMGKL